MIQRQIFTYWEGPRPPYIDVCIESMRHFAESAGIGFKCLTAYSAAHIIGADDCERMHALLHSAALRADWIRAQVLHKCGGFWFDADTMMLRSPAPLFVNDRFCYFEWPDAPPRVCNAYIGAAANSPVCRAWVDGIETQIAAGQLGWGDIGEKVLTPVVASMPGHCRKLEFSVVFPLNVDSHIYQIFEPGDWRALAQDSIAFALNHSWMAAQQPGLIGLPPRWLRQINCMFARLVSDVHFAIQ